MRKAHKKRRSIVGVKWICWFCHCHPIYFRNLNSIHLWHWWDVYHSLSASVSEGISADNDKKRKANGFLISWVKKHFFLVSFCINIFPLQRLMNNEDGRGCRWTSSGCRKEESWEFVCVFLCSPRGLFSFLRALKTSPGGLNLSCFCD